MARIQRSGQRRFSSSIWPGFVDAMTALLLVLMFVLTIFMIVQFILRETISTQDTQLDYLSAQVASLAEALGLEQQKSDGLEVEVDRLGGELSDATAAAEIQTALISTLTRQTEAQKAQLADFSAKVTSFEAQVASLLAERDRLSTDKRSLEGQVSDANTRNQALTARISEVEAANLREVSAREALELALAQARSETDKATETARLAAAKREALEAMIAETKATLGDRETSLQAALAALDAARDDLDKTTASLTETKSEAAAMKAELDAKTADLSTKEKARLAEAAAAEALRKRLADAEIALSDEEKSKLAEMAVAEALREKLKNSQTELTAMTLALEQQRRDAEDTLTLLAAAQTARKNLDDLLASALAEQKQVEIERDQAKGQVTALTSDKKTLNDRLAAVVAQLQSRGDDASRQLAKADATREDLEKRLAAALAAKLAAEQAGEQAMTKAEQREALLKQANQVLAAEKSRSAKTQREVALLNQQTAALRKQLNALQSLLDDAESRDIAAKVQIKNLGANLNMALAQVAAEQRDRLKLEESERKRLEAETKNLEKYKSEFFGQLRELLGNREGVRIVGDRFVFSSEVLFQPGDVDLSEEGKGEIAKVARVIKDIADKIPPDIDWILRVDGHTDDVPLISGGKYTDNWELSQGRALSVVRYMIDELGIPANRLAAAGFGEYQPVNREDSKEARAQNRRIELKFTEK